MTTHDALKPIRSAWHRKYRRAPIPKAGRIVVMWAHVRSDGPDIYTCRRSKLRRAPAELRVLWGSASHGLQA
jgi:hypothetical protein